VSPLRNLVDEPAQGGQLRSKPRLILHIGIGKTGSSAIQAALRRGRSQLLRQHVLIPDDELGGGTRVVGVQSMFFERLHPVDAARIEYVTRRLEALRRLAARRGAHTVVVSAENLINRREFASLFSQARELFDIEVVAYVRRQDDFIIAAWSQWYFKTSPDFRAWCDTVKGRFGDWDRVLTDWEQVLGDVKYSVRVYDRERLVDNDVVADFFATIGVSTDQLTGGKRVLAKPSVIDRAMRVLGVGQGPVNRSLNEIAMRLAARNAQHYRDARDNRFTDLLSRYGDDLVHEPINTGLFLDADERKALVALYEESNERVRLRHLPWLPHGGLFSDVFPEAGPIMGPAERTERELDLLFALAFNVYVGQWPRRLGEFLKTARARFVSGRGSAASGGRRRR
jgi:hypothetical protein